MRWSMALAAALGVAVGVLGRRVTAGSTWRKDLDWAMAGVPRGPLGWLGARGMVLGHRPLYALMADALAPRPDDDLLEVACGSGVFLKDHATLVRHVAGLDLSDIQLRMARRRLAERIATGTAELVKGDAAALPWEDARFSAVTCMGSVEFFPDPQRALREMHRVLRPGGRAAISLGRRADDPREPGATDASGMWLWTETDARRLVEDAGFVDVSVSYGRWPGAGEVRLVLGIKRI